MRVVARKPNRGVQNAVNRKSQDPSSKQSSNNKNGKPTAAQLTFPLEPGSLPEIWAWGFGALMTLRCSQAFPIV
jgi:hypothetical protein